jgi:hypothetical protein
MSLRAKPPVEPLSRAAWDRVEARVFERLDRGEHHVADTAEVPHRLPARLWAGAAIAAAAAIVLFWLGQSSAPLPNVPVAPAEVATRTIPTDTAHIATTDAPTRTTIGEATLTLGARSEVHVAGSDASGWLVRLDRGEVDCEVAPRHGRPPFVVQAGETRVTVVGTRFTVLREGLQARVQVREGRVHVESGAHDVMLAPGESWPSDPPAISSDDLPEVPARAFDPPSAPAKARGRPAQLLRRAAPVSEPGERFEQAARLEASDPEAAIAVYRKLAAGQGPWAANGLYAEARLEFERGRPQRAATLLRRYLSRYRDGSNVEDVEALLKRISTGK